MSIILDQVLLETAKSDLNKSFIFFTTISFFEPKAFNCFTRCLSGQQFQYK